MPLKNILVFFPVLLSLCLSAQPNRWVLTDTHTIKWTIADHLPHTDHIEMSGKQVSAVIRYGVNADSSFSLSRDIVWPMLRTIPNNTHASLIRSFNLDPVTLLVVNKKLLLHEKVYEIVLDGKITVKSTFDGKIDLARTLFPSTTLPAFCEKYELKNIGQTLVTLEIPDVKVLNTTDPSAGVDGSYRVVTGSSGHGVFRLMPGETARFYLCFAAWKEDREIIGPDVENELAKRNTLISEFSDNLVLETPDPVLNTAFSFAKIRAAESIFQTRGGPMHGPGGLSYYAAIWANDQGEYINPFFPFLGYRYGIESALNAYRHFSRFMNDAYNPLPSSIIAEGTDIWNGAGDRGDAAMIAYGASRFALSQGDAVIAEELWPLIVWCLEYNRRHLNAGGVVTSNSDELEGRFPSGDANLCTTSLYYDALVSAAYLGKSLGKEGKMVLSYKKEAEILRENIEGYFGADFMGFQTYRYYKGNDKLRAWICIPLTVNIFDRSRGTIDALFSPELWTADGLASQAGDKTFWDRSTLYALRGVLAAGDTKRGLEYLQYYSNRRLLGEHVPYPVEACPEGNQRHLSAESGLYCRVYTEGLFGIRPTGLNSFTVDPHLPEGWKFMRIRNISGFGTKFDLEVTSQDGKRRILVKKRGRIILDKVLRYGESAAVSF
ncbi:MAG: hypothetical protein WCO44_01280 [Bacteroidota bacterium]